MNLFGDVEPARCGHNQILGTYCSLCDLEAKQKTEEAIKQVAERMDTDWRTAAIKMLKMLCYQNETFTSDDLWYAMQTHYPELDTHEPRAMGAIMRWGVTHKWIAKTPNYVASSRPVAHKKPTAVWRSLAWRDES